MAVIVEETALLIFKHKPTIFNKQSQVMVNVRAARRYGIYPRPFSIPDEGGARVWYVKTTEGISCTCRDAVR